MTEIVDRMEEDSMPYVVQQRWLREAEEIFDVHQNLQQNATKSKTVEDTFPEQSPAIPSPNAVQTSRHKVRQKCVRRPSLEDPSLENEQTRQRRPWTFVHH